MSALARGQPPFLGRQDELERLHRLATRAFAGDAAVCFVTGEAGSGKSALLEAFAQQTKAANPDLVIAAGDCNPQSGGEEPYLPFREILSDLTDEEAHLSGPDQVKRPSGRFLEAARNAVAEHGPDLIDIFIPGGALITRVGAQAARRVRDRRRPEKLTEQAGKPGIDQGHLFEQYTNVLRKLAARKPLMLFVDDLHWADEASLDLLFHLSRRLRSEPVLLVGAYRAGADQAGSSKENPALSSRVNEMKRFHGDVWLDLSQIVPSRAYELVEGLIDAEPNRLDASFRQALFRRTGGHALFTVELLRHMKDRGLLAQDADGAWFADDAVSWKGLPARVEGVIAERVARLGDAERRLLESASVLGETFLADAVATMVGCPVRDVIRQLSGPLTREFDLVRAEGFERTGGQRVARYAFRHNLFREYFYQALDAVERVLQHESAAMSLESLYGEEAAQHAAQLAWHFDEAGLTTEALSYHRLAGQRARSEFANIEAIAHYRSVLAYLEDAGLTGLTREEVTGLRATTHADLGRVQQSVGDYGASVDSLRAALSLMRDAPAVTLAELHRCIAGSFERQGRHGEALEELASASALLGEPGDDADRAWWSAWIATAMDRVRVHYWTGDVASMSPLLDRLGELIDVHGDAHARCHFWTGQAMRGYRVHRYRPSRSTFEAAQKAVAAARESGNPIDISTALFGFGFCHMLDMEPDPAIEAFDEALQIAEQCGDRHHQGRTLAYRLHAWRLAGDIARVEAGADGAQALAEDLGMHDYVGLIMACRAWLAMRQGRWESTLETGQAALEHWKTHTPRYPLQWTALTPLLAAAAHAGQQPLAAEWIERLFDPVQAELSPELSDALRGATGADAADGALQIALERARALRYL